MHSHPKKMIYGCFESRGNALQAVRTIRRLGISRRQICVLEDPQVLEKVTNVASSHAKPLLRGALIGASICALGGAAIAGTSPIHQVRAISKQPWIRAAIGLLGGVVLGGLGGLLAGYGIPKKLSHEMSLALTNGKTILVVKLKQDSEKLEPAVAAIEKAGGLHYATI